MRLINSGGIAIISIMLFAEGRAQSSDAGHRLQSPASQVNIDSTTSAIETTMVWPVATSNRLEFDWSVDSEANWDFLKVRIDGAVAYSWSGVNRGGHVSHAMTSGSHTIRFEYVKDSSLSHGRDRGWVDNIAAVSDGRVLELHSFDERTPATGDWTSSGYGGGIQASPAERPRVFARPIAQAFTGYIATPTTSWAQQTITWPSGSDLAFSFSYLVDSETNYDFLRVLVDGVATWAKSGLETGTASINVSPGSHVIRFEYYKDTSVDVGRDIAEIGNITAIANGVVIAADDFDGTKPLGTAPTRWSTGGTYGGWVLAEPPPPVGWVKKDSPAAVPNVDGLIRLTIGTPEYLDPTVVPIFDVGASMGAPGTVLLRASESEQALYVAARLHAATTSVGSESGELVILANGDRPSAVLGVGCGSNPGTLDRKIVVSYSSASGVRTATTSAAQYWGSCQGTWGAVPSDSEKWPLTVAIAEPPNDPGFVHVEAKLTLRRQGDSSSLPLTQNSLGFALIHTNTSGALSTENFPFAIGKIVPDTNMRYWATLTFSPPQALAAASGPVHWSPAHTSAPATETLVFFGEK